jgi:hypothetical protein
MAGGLLNLVSSGQQNIVLNGNPSKTFWKTTYAKYTNFGLQKFRIDFEGSTTLRLAETSTFQFKIPRYADLLMDTYMVVNLPNIWSPILPPQEIKNSDGSIDYTDWSPYEFKWIEYLGAQMISKITITCGNQKLQEFSGSYLLNMARRDFTGTKLSLFYRMIGHIPELYDPAASTYRTSKKYPNAYFNDSPAGAEPSIYGRQLYIPLNSWFTLKSQMAFPLVSLQYNELQIYVTFRPINELFVIRDVFDYANNHPYVAPNFNQYQNQMYRFLQTPPDSVLGINSYLDQRSIWFPDVHLMSTYCFLSNDESRIFAKNEQKYLFKQVNEKIFYNITGPNKVDLDSLGLISSWMFYFQRSDVNLRNGWSNYSNWSYNTLPYDLVPAPTSGSYKLDNNVFIGPGINPDGTLTNLLITDVFSLQNIRDILLTMGVLLDGQYRENILPVGIFNYVEKFTRTNGGAPDGLYCYNFCLNTDPTDLQPSGAINMNRFTSVQLEFTTIIPPLDPFAQVLTICDPESGDIVGINKPTWRIYLYNYNLYVMEERINMVVFVGGNAALMYAT